MSRYRPRVRVTGKFPDLDALLGAQSANVRRAVTSAVERGYYVVPWDDTADEDRPNVLWGQFTAIAHALAKVYTATGAPEQRPPVSIGLRLSKPLDSESAFYFVVPNLQRYRPVNMALGLISRVSGPRHDAHVVGQGFLSGTKHSDRIEYYGTGRDALQAVISIFEIADHRRILREG
jgi:hypothetical protein